MAIVFTIRNPSANDGAFEFEFYVDGSLKMTGTTSIPAMTSKQYVYALTSPDIVKGETVRAYTTVRDLESQSVYDATVLVPPYPPEIWSSFASFATFSSSLLGYTTTLSYYLTTIGYTTTMVSPVYVTGLSLGLIFSISLIGLLVFQELSDPSYGRVGKRIFSLRKRYGMLVVSLLLIFGAMVLTRVVLIITGG